MRFTPSCWSGLVPLLLVTALAPLAAQVHPVYTVDGAAAQDRHGAALAVAPDCDGDGVPDVLVGSPGANGGRGRVVVRSGATGDVLFSWNGHPPGNHPGNPFLTEDLAVGTNVAAGTIDGLPVLVASAPQSSFFFFTPQGEPGTVEVAHVALPLTVNGTTAGQGFGTTVAQVGDANGDFFPDFLAGAPDFLAPGVRGLVRLVSGKDGTTLRTHVGATANLGRFGAALAGLGDVNGDAVPDYAIGDPEADFNGTDSGRVRIFSGATGAVLHTLDGATAGERFGFAIAASGSVFGATIGPGIAIGSPFATVVVPFPPAVLTNAGRVRVFNAQTGALEYTFAGSEAGARFGSALVLGNDASSSAFTSSDLLVGAPGRTVAGKAEAGEVRGFNLTTGALVLTVPNPAPQINAHFGEALAVGPRSAAGGFGARLFAVGAPRATVTLLAPGGRVFVLDGAGTLVGSATGLFPSGRFGASLAFAGDGDGDGIPELAVGTPGASRVSFISPTTVDAAELRFIQGAPGALVGAQICGVGDPVSEALNAFGVVVGAPGSDPPGLIDGGAVLTTTCFEPRRRAFGALEDPDDTSLAAVGDVDLDGATDFAVGIPRDASGALAAGVVTVISGRTLASLHTLSGVAGEGLGRAIAGLGDVDGDGAADFGVGCPGTDLPILQLTDVGRVRMFSGATGLQVRAITGSANGEQLGSALVGLGDVNGDGIPDLAAGAPRFGATFGAEAGRVRLFSGATGAVLRTVTGDQAGIRFGAALARAGDQNGDGVDDVLIGAPGFGIPGSLIQAGKVDLVSSATGARLVSLLGAGALGAEFGAALAAVDVDGDCLAELFVGAPGETSQTGRLRAASRFGIPAGSQVFGAGCPGSSGFTPVIDTFGGIPSSLGNPAFGVSLSCARGAALAYLLAGFSNTTFAGAALPFDLGPAGLLGCSLLVSPDSVNPLITSGIGAGAGTALVPIPVPAISALNGVIFFCQWLVIDAGAPNGSAALSPGLQVSIQGAL